jgi:hypothetical protein
MQSQDIYLQNYLGATFYQEIVFQVKSNTLNVANRFLLDNYIGPMLCNYSMYHALPFLAYKIFNKSVLKPNSETAPSIELDEVKFLQTQVREVAESYTKFMQVYLNNHLSDYPGYAAPNSQDGIAPDNKTPFFSGLQTNSNYFNYAKYTNYPYGRGSKRPAGAGFGTNPGEQCYGCNDAPMN